MDAASRPRAHLDRLIAVRGLATLHSRPLGSGSGLRAQADRRESKVIQAIPVGLMVAALVTAGLLVVFALDHPYANWSGSITDRDAAFTRDDRGRPPDAVRRGGQPREVEISRWASAG